ncbi:MAG: hypothetical protein JXQ83_00700 [Candidatus Glassbacteria bacterium]|nr:hypothetical protein [Candidatus Glassbacteria bacterium]
MSRIDPTYGEMKERIGELEKEVKKGRADRNRLKKLEKQYAKSLEESDRLFR